VHELEQGGEDSLLNYLLQWLEEVLRVFYHHASESVNPSNEEKLLHFAAAKVMQIVTL
jgi:hypothetical protein